MSTKSKQAVAVEEVETELLEVNVYFGRIPESNSGQDDSVNIDPFVNNGFRVTSVPVYLHDPMAEVLTNGVTVPRRNPVDTVEGNDAGGVHITGEQIARGYAWNTLLKQVELLASVVNPGSLVINISRCGLIGKYAMRFLVGIPGIKVNFLNFPPSWRGLDKLAPITNQHFFFNTAKEEIVSDPASTVEETAPEQPVETAKKPSTKKPAAKKKSTPVVAASEEQLASLADKFPTAKKPAAKKKADTPVELPVEADEEDDVPVAKKPAAKKPAPKKKPAVKAAVVAE